MERLTAFMQLHVYPNEHEYRAQINQEGARWSIPPLMRDLKRKAQAAGLWNLSLTNTQYGQGLTHLEYAPLAETFGRVLWAAEVFNCNPPDAGNMELLYHYASVDQKRQWLDPLASGEIRSCFAMTEPQVASSDATNVQTRIERVGDTYVINGRKWFTTGVMYDQCKVMIVMGKTDPDNVDVYRRQSQVLVPMSTPGIRIVRPLTTFGYLDEPLGHGEVLLENVKVPVTNIIGGEGRGFEIAQGRLGPGRIHHCMRLIGVAQRALELTCTRAADRRAFGRTLGEQGSVREDIAWSAAQLEQARLLTLHAAAKMDRDGAKEARDLIAMAKIAVPSMAIQVIDRAIQIHGGAGLTADVFLAEAFNYARSLRILDGPDQVHLASLGKHLIRRHAGTAQRPSTVHA